MRRDNTITVYEQFFKQERQQYESRSAFLASIHNMREGASDLDGTAYFATVIGTAGSLGLAAAGHPVEAALVALEGLGAAGALHSWASMFREMANARERNGRLPLDPLDESAFRYKVLSETTESEIRWEDDPEATSRYKVVRSSYPCCIGDNVRAKDRNYPRAVGPGSLPSWPLLGATSSTAGALDRDGSGGDGR